MGSFAHFKLRKFMALWSFCIFGELCAYMVTLCIYGEHFANHRYLVDCSAVCRVRRLNAEVEQGASRGLAAQTRPFVKTSFCSGSWEKNQPEIFTQAALEYLAKNLIPQPSKKEAIFHLERHAVFACESLRHVSGCLSTTCRKVKRKVKVKVTSFSLSRGCGGCRGRLCGQTVRLTTWSHKEGLARLGLTSFNYRRKFLW